MSRARAFFVAIIVALAALGLARHAEASDFRGNDWGATPEVVKAKEKLALASEAADELVYSVVIGKMAGQVRYKFGPKGLYRAVIVSTQVRENAMDYIGDYVHLHEIVSRAHGVPIVDETRFTDESKRSDPDAWPAALKSGAMVVEAKWIRPRTSVVLRLGGSEGVVSLTADFTSAKIKGDVE